MGTQGINIALAGRATGNFLIDGNSISFIKGLGIGVGANGLVTMNVTISNNTINAFNTVGSAGIGGGTTDTFAETDNPLANFNILSTRSRIPTVPAFS